ncbi:unnamed protein product [Clonostachys byssicola]|uniref:Peptidase M43 pregnancy-associated plasma-A domain-containing protein n=1 Tax=Clonostachys byssicola TaxID=160290 RepID=A0A9N9U1K1_9HYPO|nr:unnamed protein product [Clonostachys byssicola]
MLILGLLIGTALAVPSNWCGNKPPTSEHRDAIQALRVAETAGSSLLRRQSGNSSSTINVPVYVTAVVNTTDSEEMLSETVLKSQFDVLSDRFVPYNITFTLKSTSRMVDDNNSKGFDYNGWNSFKAAQRKGDYGTLNLFYVTNMDDQTWGSGSCTLPGDASGGPLVTMLDGCTMNAYTVPGGVSGGKTYKGEITVHEVGHWFSLLHTFDGDDCIGPGDYIDDTPQEATWELNVCPVGRDSCPDQPGLDPITNYMDYAGLQPLADKPDPSLIPLTVI